MEALYGSQHEAQRSTFAAFYSSELGGIVTDPALMVVQIDDHMLHRGHGGALALTVLSPMLCAAALRPRGHAGGLGAEAEI